MRKKLLSALLSMCMMLTMLPMSAFAAEGETDPKPVQTKTLEWTNNEYKLSADTTVTDGVATTEGEYKLDLDTFALKVNSFDVAAGSSLEITAKNGSESGVYAIDKDIAFNLGGAVVTGKDVIFNHAVTTNAPAPKAKAIPDASTLSGTFKDDLTIGSNVKATLTNATLEGKLVVGEKAELTVDADVNVAKDVEVSGKLIINDNAYGAVQGKLVMKEGGEIVLQNDADFKPYTFDVSGTGTVSVYQLGKDTDGKDVYQLMADVTAKAILPLPTGDTVSLWFTNSVDKMTIDGVDVTNDIDKDSNTYLLNTDTEAHTIAVDFHRSSGGGGGGSSGYSVNVASTTNGTVTVSPKNASKGATVTVTAKPDKGYVLDTLTVTDKDGKKIDLTDKGDNKFTFVMPAGSVTVKATFKVAPKTPFTDVAESAWYADAVAYVYENGMMKGTSDTKFSPEQTTTRGMIVTILYRLEKEPSASAASFTDVASGKYYSKAVAWASANKIVTGYGDGKFGPNDTITREQMAAILYRYASYKGYDVTKTADLSKFTDASQVGVFAKAAMQWANAEGLINGTSTTKLSPKSGATRAEVATILMRFCENIAK